MQHNHNASAHSDSIIETYIQQLLAWEAPLTVETLNSLAEEVGLGPAEIAAIQKKAQAHFKRGSNYLNRDYVDDAIEELTQATALAPLELDILQTLSTAYAQRYQQQKSATDKAQCIAIAKRCLEISPEDSSAIALIHSLKTTASKPHILALTDGLSPSSLLAGLSKYRLAATCSAVTGLSVMAIGYNLMPTQFNTGEPGVAPSNSTELAQKGPADKNKSEGNTSSTQAEVDIPVTFDHPGITIEPRLSRLDNYEETSFYKLQGVVKNEGTQELDSLVIKVEYLDKDGTILATDSEEAVEDFTPTIRPGDSHTFDLIEELSPALATLRLSVTTIDQLPAASSYTPAPPIDYTWGFSQPAQIQFELGARTENVSTSYTTHFDADWVVINTGETAIRELKFQVDFYDESNNITSSKEVYAVLNSYAALLPTEKRPFRVFEEVPEDYARYTVEVLEAE